MLPGKKYSPEDLLVILRRRIWWVLVPFAVIAAATALAARTLPDTYRSESVMLVTPQKVPEAYVRTAVTARLDERLQAIQQLVLGRSRLERLINEFGLYADELQTQLMQDVVERMRTEHIQVELLAGDAFRVSFTGRDPAKVQLVTERLADSFVEESRRDRQSLADSTSDFLSSELEEAQRVLTDLESQVEVYRRTYAGELPEQQNANLQAIQNAQMQIQSIVTALNRDSERRLTLEQQIDDLETPTLPDDVSDPRREPVVVNTPNDLSKLGGPARDRLRIARSYLVSLQRQGLTPQHPDIRDTERIIKDLEQQADEEALDAPLSTATSMPVTAAERERMQKLDAARASLELLDSQMASKRAEEQRLRGVVADYQARLEATPTRETELAQLTRGYETQKGIYETLLQNTEESQRAAALERRQIGEQFRMVEPARMPEKPISPNRTRINLIGMAAGLAFGIGLVALFEYRDTTFRLDDDVSRLTDLPVLAVVPLMESPAEVRRATRLRWVTRAGLGGAVAACLAIVAYAFIR